MAEGNQTGAGGVSFDAGLSRDELYGLTSQMRCAAVSIASNIAEGKGRFSCKEFAQFLYRARGSLLELETQLFIANELGYLGRSDARQIETQVVEMGRVLNGLTKRLQQVAVPES